ncbi:MAG: hypothetical protein IT516_12590 [Burkholderiales bacterium]|nr:hypothetical protein [Burkholderiales bacterium]
MTSVVNTKFAVKPVAAALALGLSTAAGVALAAPTPNQMPGSGIVSDISMGSTTVLGTKYINLVSPTTITVDGKVVIRWGDLSMSLGETTNPYGFNLGQNASLTFTGLPPGAGGSPAVLNIDASGNPSQIYGTLVTDKSGGAIPQLFLANANGIVVAPGARIVAPAGVGLLGAELDNKLSRDDFVGNNGWVNPPGPSLGTSYLTFGALPTTGITPGLVEIGGAINGDLVKNDPAAYVLIAGNNVNVLNTGNIFGEQVTINAGLIATATTATVNGVTNVTVNRLFNVDTALEVALGYVGTAPGMLTISGPAGSGNIVNEGSISARGLLGGDTIALQAAGNIRSGIDGDSDTLVGLFSDQGIWIDSYSDTSTVEIYNVVAGYTTNKTLPYLHVNSQAANPIPFAQAFRPDVIVNAITPGYQPSSITTTDEVEIYGGNVTIASTINHMDAPVGPNTDDLVLDASKALVVSADVGAGDDVFLDAGTDMTISGNVRADTEGNGSGGIYGTGGTGVTTVSGNLSVRGPSSDDIHFDVYNTTLFSGDVSTPGGGDFIVDNSGTGAGNSTTISGDVTSGGGVYITQYLSPANNSPIVISGDIVAAGGVTISNLGASWGNTTTITGSVTSLGSGVAVTNLGQLTGLLDTTGGVINADTTAVLTSDGDAKIGMVNADNIVLTAGGLNVEVNEAWIGGTSATIISPLATTKFLPTGVVTAPAVTLTGLHFRGVDATGNAYATQADKPASQFVTQVFTTVLSGSINAPIAGNTNWPLNSMDIAPLVTLAPVLVSVTANGGGFQAVNLNVLGNAVFNTGATQTPFIGVPLTTGGFPAGGLQGNLGSQLIMQAAGSLTIVGTPTFSLTGPAFAAQWPGGATFVAGTTLQLLAPFYNAWSVASPPFGGVFFTAPAISMNNYIATSGTAWANFSTKPLTGDPTVYQIRTRGDNSFGFDATEAFVKNDYMSTVVGGAVCGILGPTTWTACP